MRAEIAGKLSMSSPSAQDRLEDTLTDGVFSSLSYLPRDVLGGWLRAVLPVRFHADLTLNALEGARFDFWPTLPGRVEPDVIIRLGSLLVVIEAKYQSPFSNIGGLHQLAAQWTRARAVVETEGLEGPIVVAVTDDVIVPRDLETARDQLRSRGLLAAQMRADEAITWTTWQGIANAVDQADTTTWTVGHSTIVEDLFTLMRRRKVRFMYEGFKIADWWLLAAAADAASERVYPTIAEFARELTAVGAARDLIWGGSDSGVVWYESKQVGNAADWHRNYVQLPMLHKRFGKRLQNYCALYVLFTFNRPAIRAGFWFQLKKADLDAQQADAIAAWLRSLDGDIDVVESTAWESEVAPIIKEDITGAWVLRTLSTRGGWLRVERVWDPGSLVSTEPAVDVLTELSASLLSNGSVLEALERNGTLDRTHVASGPDLGALTDESSVDGGPAGASQDQLASDG